MAILADEYALTHKHNRPTSSNSFESGGSSRPRSGSEPNPKSYQSHDSKHSSKASIHPRKN